MLNFQRCSATTATATAAVATTVTTNTILNIITTISIVNSPKSKNKMLRTKLVWRSVRTVDVEANHAKSLI